MSAFIVGNDTINRVLTFVITKRDGDSSYSYAARNFLDDPAVHGGVLSTPAAIGQRLYDLNVQAVSQRYPGETVDTLPGPTESGYRFSFSPSRCPAPINAYKALQCLTYQCSEGDVPETPLFKALMTLRYELAESIVADLPTYDAAPWG